MPNAYPFRSSRPPGGPPRPPRWWQPLLALTALLLATVPGWAQTYQPLTVSGGFNVDVVADGTGSASSKTTDTFDDNANGTGGYVLMAQGYNNNAGGSAAAGRGLPTSRSITSLANSGLSYSLAPYDGKNDLRMKDLSTNTLTFSTASPSPNASAVYLLAASGSAVTVLPSVQVTFANGGGSETFSDVNIPSWYSGNPYAILGLGRVGRNGSVANNIDNDSNNPRLYDIRLQLSPANIGKQVASVTVTKNSGSGVFNLMAVSVQVAPPPTITGLSQTSGLNGITVTINGNNLDQVRSVRFGAGGLPTTQFTAQGANSLTVVVPEVAQTGALTLTTVSGASVTSTQNFTVLPRRALTATLSTPDPLDVCQPRTLTAAATSPGFNVSGTGFNGNVSSVAVQPDGKLLVGGNFTSYNGTTANYLVRLNTDGTRDTDFNASGTGFDLNVNSVAVQPDGKVLVGGYFTSYNGIPANYLVRLNANGTRDTDFNAYGGGPNDAVNSVVVQADGKLLVGGFFASYSGIPANSLVRLHTDGSLDNGFNTGGTGFNGNVRSVAVQADGKLLVGGEFNGYNRIPANSLVRLNTDGTRDTGFDPSGAGFDNAVYSVAVQPDGKVLVGGYFTSYNGTTANYLARLNANGTRDTGFNTGGAGFNAGLFSVAVQADGKLLAGGNFTSYNGSPANYLARLNADGTRDTGFNTGGAGFNDFIRAVAVQADGKVLVGGRFRTYNGTTANRLVRLNADGTLNNAPTSLTGATFTFLPGNTTTNPLTTSTAGSYTATATLEGNTSAASNTLTLKACPSVAPTVSTTTPTSITTTSATLGGNVTADGGAEVTERGVVYVAGTGPPTTSDTKLPSGMGTGNFTVTAPSLTPGTQYTVRAYATNSAGTSYGSPVPLKTATPPVLSQVVTIFYGPNSGAFSIPDGTTQVLLQAWGGGGGGGGANNDKGWGGGGGGGGGYSGSVAAVSGGQVISYAAGDRGDGGAATVAGTNGGNSTVGTVTAGGGTGGAPASATSLGGAGGTGGSGTYQGGAGSAGISAFTFGQSSNLGGGGGGSAYTNANGGNGFYSSLNSATSGGGGTGSGGGGAFSNAMMFSGAQIGNEPGGGGGGGAANSQPRITAGARGGLGQVRVTLCGPVSVTTQPLASQSVCQNAPAMSLEVKGSTLAQTYQWYRNATNATTGGTAISNATSSFYNPSTSTAGTVYYYAVVSDACGTNTATSSVAAVTVNPTPGAPTGAASQSYAPGSTVADLKATPDAGGTVQWFANASGGAPLDPATALTNNTTYYAQQSVNGCSGTSRLAVKVTLAQLATVTTVTPTPSSITSTSATLGGSVTSDGGAAVTERGVVYSSTATTLTLGGAGVTQAANGSGTGSFSAAISGLMPATTYYVRAYATNSVGTSYGSVQTFTTLAPAPTLTGIDPASGPAGTMVKLTGTGFSPGSQVFFGSIVATNVGGAGSNSISVIVPAGVGPGPVTVTVKDAGGTSGGVTFTVTASSLTWTGAVSTDWATAGNWNPAQVPTNSLDLTIPAGPANQPRVSGKQQGRDVTLNNGARLTLAASAVLTLGDPKSPSADQLGSLRLNEGSILTQEAGSELYLTRDLTNNGATFALDPTSEIGFGTSAGQHELNGSAGLTLPTVTVGEQAALGSVDKLTVRVPLRIARKLGVYNGGTAQAGTGGSLTLLSDATGTALIENADGGLVNGPVTVQRYIDPSKNPGLGYRHLAAPVLDATVAAFGSGGTTPVVNGAYNSAANPGQVASFPTVFFYDQARLETSPATTLSAFDKGWQSPAALTDAAPLLSRGFTVQLPGASTLSFTGAVSSGSIGYEFSRLTGPAAADAGWQLTGNPYPSPLNLSTILANQRPNLDAAFYTYESTSQYGGSYRSYVNGVGDNPLIGTAQAFFVRVSEGQTTGALLLDNANRVTDYAQPAPVRRTGADPRPQLQLTLAGAGLSDALTLYAEAGATGGFDKEYDAAKLWNPSGLSLATLAASGQALAIDGRPALPLAQPVPLTVQAPRAGTYTLTATSLANLPAGALTLVDLRTGTRTPLVPGARYSLTLPAGATAGRLQLESAAALATASPLAQQLSVYPNPTADGQVQLVRPAAWGPVQVQVLNAVGQSVHSARLLAGEATLDLRALASGVYSLRLTTQDGQTLTKRLVRE